DGFNRSMEAVQHNFTPGKSLVLPSDTRFQPSETGYLPYSAAGYGFRANAFAEQQAYYNSLYPGEGNTAYSLRKNNAYAGELKIGNYSPGKSQVGQDRSTQTVTVTNDANLLRRWSVNAAGLPVSNGFYPLGELFCNQTLMPLLPGNPVPPYKLVYKNKDGRVIAERTTDSVFTNPAINITYITTLYLYNDQGQLCYVIPPAAADNAMSSGSINQQTLDQYCFQYRYDDKGRKVEQKVPGKGWEYFVYDKRGRLTFYQDSLLRTQSNSWTFTLYDGLDRALMSGIYGPSGESRAMLQAYYEDPNSYGTNTIIHYMKDYNLSQSYPSGLLGVTPLNYFYYDDYKNADPSGVLWATYASELQFSEQQSIPGSETPARTSRTRGLPTGSLVKILPSPGAEGTGAWRRTALFYDDKGRVIYSASQDLNPDQSVVHAAYNGSQFSFSGQVLGSKQVLINQKAGDGYTRHSEVNKNEYETATGRLSKTWRRVDNAGAWTLTGSYTYDELGRLQRQVLGNNGESRDYSYNIRGQLTGINGAYAETGNKQGQNLTFGQSLKYDYGFDKPRYDGKIAGMIWRGSDGDASVFFMPKMHAYGYDYDMAGRLKLADYYLQRSAMNPWNKGQLDFTVSNLYYDKNGNIRSMNQRGVDPVNGPVDMDVLRYGYVNGNQLDAVTDNGVADYGAGDF
ncbi:hypothetical protein, partial [Taibaiella koreensis]|uniref:hypothetical protein n=1 Tax=Taibaiella koreensis TaxID=1268548 RepID=UPI0013C2CC06